MQLQQSRDDLHSLIWDMYKDVYGVRPRHLSFETMTLQQLESEVEHLAAALEIELEYERKQQQKAIVEFEWLINSTIATGAGDRATALRWIHTAHSTDGDDEYLCYQLGLPYGYFKR